MRPLNPCPYAASALTQQPLPNRAAPATCTGSSRKPGWSPLYSGTRNGGAKAWACIAEPVASPLLQLPPVILLEQPDQILHVAVRSKDRGAAVRESLAGLVLLPGHRRFERGP